MSDFLRGSFFSAAAFSLLDFQHLDILQKGSKENSLLLNWNIMKISVFISHFQFTFHPVSLARSPSYSTGASHFFVCNVHFHP